MPPTIEVANPERMVLEAIAAALTPPPIDYLAFAVEHIVLDGPFAGPYNRALFPFFDEILQALGPEDPCRYVTLMSSAQCGKTTIAGIFALGAVTLGQGAFLVAHPTEDSARRWSRMKLSTLMRSTAIVREMFPQLSRDSADAVFYKERRDGLASILITGANSPASLSQVTIAKDDLAKWDVNSAGDPEAMADSRSRAMPDAKILKISTPLITPGCRITKSFLDDILTSRVRTVARCRFSNGRMAGAQCRSGAQSSQFLAVECLQLSAILGANRPRMAPGSRRPGL